MSLVTAGTDRASKRKLSNVALGSEHADLVIRGGALVNVYTREVYPAEIAIAGNRIAAVDVDLSHAVGPLTDVLDADGRFLVPGFIDTHSHVHESQLPIPEYARAVIARGTTSVSTDFYGELVVGGVAAVDACLDAARTLPLKLLFMLGTPGYSQNFPFGHSGWPTLDDMRALALRPECVGMDDSFAAYIADGESGILDLVDEVQSRGLWVSSHGAEMTGRRLQAWMAYLGATDDHECVSADDAVAKSRLGVYVTAREGAGCYNLAEVIKAITVGGIDPRRFCFNTDVPSSVEIADLGHIDHSVRMAIELGIEPLVALQMATLNASECLGVTRHIGAISPGKIADVLLVGDLRAVDVQCVIADGRIVLADGDSDTAIFVKAAFPQAARDTVIFKRAVVEADFAIRTGAPDGRAPGRVIGAFGHTVTTDDITEMLDVFDGYVLADQARDLLKIAAIERVRGTGEIGVGLVTGFHLKGSCALATTFNSQQQNCIVVGTTDHDMAVAANELARVGGGFIAVRDGCVAAMLELPLFGLLSEEPYEVVVAQLKGLLSVVAEMGCDMQSPFATLGFVGLPVDIGHLKICPEGLVDVWSRSIVEV